MKLNNYLDTTNPFGLATPPTSFLTDLFTYDHRLVLFPSVAEPVYRLCRRASGAFAWERFDPRHLDTAICQAHRLMPLKAVQGFHPAWGQLIMNSLAACDVQRVGGGTAAAELLDASDELERRRLDLAIADEASVRAGHAYRELGFHTGRTVIGGVKNPDGAGAYGQRRKFGQPKPTKKRVYRPRASGDGAIFVGH